MNLTPHPVNLIRDGQIVATWLPGGTAARITERCTPHQEVQDSDTGVTVPISEIEYLGITGLPEEDRDTIYLVSRVTAQASPRADLVFPADEQRDKNGTIIGCTCLGRFLHP